MTFYHPSIMQQAYEQEEIKPHNTETYKHTFCMQTGVYLNSEERMSFLPMDLFFLPQENEMEISLPPASR